MKAPKKSNKLVSICSAASAHAALRQGQFIPYFQPIVTFRTGQLAGFEVLARWQRPQHGLVSPDQFIPLAEKQGWIDTLTQTILRRAFAEAIFIPDPLTLSVNISPVQLLNSNLPQLIRDAAKGTQFSLKRLVIEITESALIDNLDHAASIARELKAMGCKLALDDFGTGYSSLLHLQALPFDELKIDQSFVSSMTEMRESRKIVAGVVGIGQSLGLRTVAEGIETREQAETMLWLGCELGQGWYFGRPLPAEDLPSVVTTHRQKLPDSNSSQWREISSTNLDGSLSQRLAHLQAVYDGAPVALCFLNADLRYVSINQRLADLNGVSIGDHIGRPVSDLVAPDVYAFIEPYLLRALKGHAISGLEISRPSAEPGFGDLTDLSYYQPARDEAGEVIGLSIAIVDITQSKRAEEALRESEDRYQHTIRLSPHIPWIMDANGMNLEVSPLWEQITGQPPEQTLNSGFQSVMHPEDLANLMPSFQNALLTGEPMDFEYRLHTKEGDWLWVRSRGKASRDIDGKISKWYGSAEDISQLKKLMPAPNLDAIPPAPPTSSHTDSTKITGQIYVPRPTPIDPAAAISTLLGSDWSGARHIFESVANGITISDVSAEMPLIYVNPAFEQLTGYDMDEIRGKNCRFLQAGERNQPGLPALRDALTQRRDVRTVLKNFRKDGTPFWNELYLSPIRSCGGDVTHYVGIQNDVTARVELQEKLAHLAHHDMLTGLANRALLMERLAKALSRAKRNGRMVAVLFFDLDNLKSVNDVYGHGAGDLMIQVVGHRLGTATRKHETAARIGGDEFVVVLEDIEDEQAAQKIKRRLTDEIKLPMWASQQEFSPSASIGMALYPGDGQTPGELLRFADMAMYLAKSRSKQVAHVIDHPALVQ